VANSQAVKGPLGAVVLVALAAGCGGTTTVTVTNTVTHVKTVTVHKAKTTPTTTTTATASTTCAAGALKGSFDVVEGSAGAGQITYRLTLTNIGSSPCFVFGIPQVQLLGTTGGALPTTASAEPGQGPGAKITLQPGGSATSDARFSPDVNGEGDKQQGQCQPSATVLRVTAPGGGVLDAPVQPPTPVCQRGSLHFRPFVKPS
jgi:Domain of unknown function (DUF4232)